LLLMLDGGRAMTIGAFHPHHAPLPLRAHRVFGAPPHHRLGRGDAVSRGRLPTLGVRHRAKLVKAPVRRVTTATLGPLASPVARLEQEDACVHGG